MKITSKCIRITEQKDLFFQTLFVCLLCSFGEFACPNKALKKDDLYQGYWKEGKMHGLGTYR